MRLFYVRCNTRRREAGDVVIDKALEKYREQAQEKVRGFLCPDCLDQRCMTGSMCKTFITMTAFMATDIVARASELN